MADRFKAISESVSEAFHMHMPGQSDNKKATVVEEKVVEIDHGKSVVKKGSKVDKKRKL